MLRARCVPFVPTVAGALLVALLAATPALSQIPDEFTNLQVLDADTQKGQLIGIMRDWAGALGVRCAHCHVGPDNLQGMDFASDEKATKRTARQMLVMARKVNRELLTALPIVAAEGRERTQAVSCYTCHRGLPTPPRRTLNELFAVGRTAAAEGSSGADAAIARYQELREEHEGAGRYDLRPNALFRLARRYMETRQSDGAREVITALQDLFPDFADSWALLAQIEMMAGNRPAAEAALEHAFEIEPDNQLGTWLRSQMPPAPEETAEGEADGGG